MVIPLKCMVLDRASTARVRPESGQFCFDSSDETYRCWQAAVLRIKSFVRGNIDNYTIKDKDRYGRLVVGCFVDGKNINKRLCARWVRAGL